MESELVTVATDFSPTGAEVIRLLLNENGIDCQLDGAQQGGLAGVQTIGILVRREDAERAKQLIHDHDG